MSAAPLTGLATRTWKVALFGLFLVAVVGCQADQSTTLVSLAPVGSVEEARLIGSPDGLPPGAARIAQKYRIPANLFFGISAEVFARVDVHESQVRSYEEFASDGEHQEAMAQWIVECYTRAGWPSKVDPPGSGQIVYEGPNAPKLRGDPNIQLCLAEGILLFPMRPAPQTREEWQYSYDHQMSIAKCLDAEGYGMADPPTLDTYIDSGGRWFAYEVVPVSVSSAEWDRLIVVCRQV